MKDPYLRPVIFGGLFITFLSIIFSLGIFLWAVIGGYIAVRLASKITKELISLTESLILGMLSGVVGGTCLDVLTVISFKDPDNKRSLIRTLESNWPKDIPLPNFNANLSSIFFTTCIFIILITTIFAIIGGYLALYVSKRKASS